MPTGRVGAAALAATTSTTVYTVPASTIAAVNINICNRGTAAATVRLALAAADTPTTAEWIEYDCSVPANGVLERTGIVLAAGQKVVAYASTADVTATVYGMEESA